MGSCYKALPKGFYFNGRLKVGLLEVIPGCGIFLEVLKF